MDILLLIGRLCYGSLFIYNGIQHFVKNTQISLYAQGKGVPMPRIAVLITGIMIILGGLGIVLGIYIKLSVLLISLFLLSTLLTVHTFWKEENHMAKSMEHTQFMKNLALLGASLMMLSILDPWSLSL